MRTTASLLLTATKLRTSAVSTLYCRRSPQLIRLARQTANSPGRPYPPSDLRLRTLQIDFPLKYVWDLPNLKRPIRIQYVLNKRIHTTKGGVIAEAGPIEFQ